MWDRKKPARLSVVIGLVLVVGMHDAASTDLPPDSWLLPFDINIRHKPSAAAGSTSPSFTQEDIYEFAWQSFIALSWPANRHGDRGEPATQRRLSPWDERPQSRGPVVWETYRRPDQVFLAPALWPFSWNDDFPPEECSGADQPFSRVLNVNVTNYSENADGINQPYTHAHYPTGPVLDQNERYLRYEVAMNESYFSYIKHYRYFRPQRQIRSVRAFVSFVKEYDRTPPKQNDPNSRFFQPLPNGEEAYLTSVFRLKPYALQGIVEVKAAWKLLGGSDVPGRFYRRRVFFLNPNGECSGPHLVGLVGLHIHRVVPFGKSGANNLGAHIGATFEQVDNVKLRRDSRSHAGPFPLPPHPSLNPGLGSANPPPYLNGYEVGGESGFSGLIPGPLADGQDLPPVSKRPMTNVSREVPIPGDVEAVNRQYRNKLKGSVWFYYQLIGTQNPNLNDKPNGHLGPGVIGAQASNVQNLINTTLESYTQNGFSCARCHLNAFPQGVQLPLPPFEQNFAPLHVISFLLLNAKENDDE
jgi:hypothetical protein